MASEPTTDPTDERPGADPADESVSSSAEAPKAAPAKKRATRKRASSPRATAKDKGRTKGKANDKDTAKDRDTETAPTPTDEGTAAAAPGTGAEADAPRGADAPDDRVESPQHEAFDSGEPLAAEEDEQADPADDEPTAASTEEPPGEETRSGDEGGDDQPSIATVPSFGLLFQAPEPVAPRRRRATAAAGAPPMATASEDGRTGDDRRSAGEAEAADEAARDGGAATTTDAEDDGEGEGGTKRSRRRGGRGRRSRGAEQTGTEDADGTEAADTGRPDRTSEEPDGADAATESTPEDGDAEESTSGSRRRRRRRRGSDGDSDEKRGARAREEVTAVKGSTRLEAKKQRRREGREAGRRRQIITEAEFLARRESVDRVMVVREHDGKTQIGVLEDGVLVEHYVSRETGASMIGNVHLGRVQNVLPSMEAAFVDIGKGRNAVLYAGEVNWDAAGLEGNVPKRIENALTSGDTVLVQVTKDPVGHKGARLTSQISLPGRFLVYVPEASMTGISRKLPDTERARLKSILKKIVPDDAGVIVRTAAEGASEEELTADIERLTRTWEKIRSKAETAGKRKGSAGAPLLLHGEPDLTVKVIRDVFNEDFSGLVVAGERAWTEVSDYLEDVAPELAKRLTKWTSETDLFTHYRVDEQLAKALDRKVWLPSGGSLVIDRTEAMTVVDVNTGKFVGSGGNLEETVTKNNIEAAEEIVRQLRLRDIGGIIVIDFIDMVLESNRDLVVRRLLECLGRDRTKHQVAEVTSLGLVQMTRKRVGTGLLEVFSEPCSHCSGRGVIVHTDPLDPAADDSGNGGRGRGRGRGGNGSGNGSEGKGARGGGKSADGDRPGTNGPTAAQIAAAAHAAALKAVATPAPESAPVEDTAQPVLADSAPQPDSPQPASEPSAVEPSATPDTELTSQGEVGDEAASPVSQAPDAPTHDSPVSQASAPSGADEAVGAAAPARPRRKRGRVVAPAGPPGQSEVRLIAGEDA